MDTSTADMKLRAKAMRVLGWQKARADAAAAALQAMHDGA